MNFMRTIAFASLISSPIIAHAELVDLQIDPELSGLDVTLRVLMEGEEIGSFTRPGDIAGRIVANVSRDLAGNIVTIQPTPETDYSVTGVEEVIMDLGVLGTVRWSFQNIRFTFASTVFPPYSADSPIPALPGPPDPILGGSTYIADLSGVLMPAFSGYVELGPGTGAIGAILTIFDPDGVFEFSEFDDLDSFPSEIIINPGGGSWTTLDQPSGVERFTLDLDTTDFDLIPALGDLFTIQLTLEGRIVAVPEASSFAMGIAGLSAIAIGLATRRAPRAKRARVFDR